MTSPRKSELCLEIRLPTEEGHPIIFTAADSRTWDHKPPGPLSERTWDHKPPRPLSERLQANVLWERMDKNWKTRHDILQQAGAALGTWLFDERATLYLREQVRAWTDDQPHLRLELRVPRRLAAYPWEIAALEGVGHLAVNRALTVVRIGNSGAQQPAPPAGQLACHVVGVKHDNARGWIPLRTEEEVERVRQEIETAGSRGRFAVEIDPLGDWSALVERYTKTGPPHVFHFAGHGVELGKGLVFRGIDGQPEEVTAQQVAELLAHRRKGRQTHLAFLNACTTAATGRTRLQPFGGVADLLIQHGIPMVVGLQTPVGDTEAVELAREFYAALSRGDTVDYAVQEARRKLFLLGSKGVGWAFLSLIVSCQPEPLCRASQPGLAEAHPELLMTFGHEVQRQRLERFLRRKRPTVIVVHGEERSGQRHVLQRVQFDLERAGNVLWRPVAALRLHSAGNLLFRRAQLAGGIARALSVADTGTQKELEQRLARTIADRCADDRVLVIDLREVVTFHTAEQADSILTLIQDLWVDLMENATTYRSSLPVFLLVPVAYPRLLPDSHPKAGKVREMSALTEQTIKQLDAKKRLKSDVRVEVLPKLEAFDEHYVAGFLEDVLELDPDTAGSRAAHMVGLNDNETILDRLRLFLADWGRP